MFTVPDFVTTDVVTIVSAVLAGLAVMWAARKVIKTVNRS